jgi:HD-like signal output (HDOD) protein
MNVHHTTETSSVRNQMGMALRDIGIPPRPTILAKIDQEMLKEEPDFMHLARLINADVALSAALLKTANSPFFGFDKKVRSVQEALLVLGLKVVTQTIAGIALQRCFEHVPNMERFWCASAATARVSGWLARRLSHRCCVRGEDAYTFGLFRDCGIPVLMAPFPEYRTVLGKANTEKLLRFTDVEDGELSTNHADIGTSLAQSWRLPEEIVEAISHHHALDTLMLPEQQDAPAISLPLIALAQLAEYLIAQRTGMNKTCEWEKVAGAVMQVLGIDEQEIAVLLEDCKEAVAEN